MERGEWENDPEYPRAPVPPHERTWRHPSELGQSQWVQSEPPLVVGRGLSIATGAVGAVLALGLLWLMIPHSEHGGVAVESSMPLSRSQPSASLLGVQTTTPPNTSVSTTANAVVATTKPEPATTMTTLAITAAPSTTIRTTTSTVPAIEVDGTTVSEPLPALAVALVPGHLVVTTAAAVSGRTEISVKLSTGDTVKGSVVAVDEASGTAVVAVPIEIANPQIVASTVESPTEGLVLGSAASIWPDDTGMQVSYGADVHPGEASLVLDNDGGLIGMCTKKSSGLHLVGVKDLLDAVDDATTSEASAWVGISAELSGTGDVTVVTVDPDGLAAAAGVQAGDVVRAIDGTTVTDLSGLRDQVLTHSPGQTMTLSVIHPGATVPVDVTITLSKKPWGQ